MPDHKGAVARTDPCMQLARAEGQSYGVGFQACSRALAHIYDASQWSALLQI